MTRALHVAFYGEGPTDARVIPALVAKIITDLPLVQLVEFSINGNRWPATPSFPATVVAAVEQARIAQPRVDLIVGHLDADSKTEHQVWRRKVVPAAQALLAAHLLAPPIAWAVPVQAVEAWLLASTDAFAQALEQPGRARELRWPPDIEKVHRDRAKEFYEQGVYHLLARTRRHGRIHPESYQAGIAAEVSLPELRRLPAFQRFESRLTQTLTALGYV